MSWSVSAVGKPGPVAAKLAKELANITYLGKEEAALKDIAASLIDAALAANTRKDLLVNVSANGSGSTHPADGNQQTVSVIIGHIYGFVE
jgi:hypothetical protein